MAMQIIAVAVAVRNVSQPTNERPQDVGNSPTEATDNARPVVDESIANLPTCVGASGASGASVSVAPVIVHQWRRRYGRPGFSQSAQSQRQQRRQSSYRSSLVLLSMAARPKPPHPHLPPFPDIRASNQHPMPTVGRGSVG